MLRRAIVVAWTAALVAAVALRAQRPGDQPQATFRAGVDLIQLDVSVLDRNRRPVRGLTAEDFTISDDGVPRQIAAFSAIDLPSTTPAHGPATATWTRDVATDVASNQAADEGRLVVIVMDRSIPPSQATFTARRIATAAIDGLGPSDLAAVVSTLPGLPQNFTNDHARLKRAVAGLGLGGAESTTSAEITQSQQDALEADTGVQLPRLGRLDDGQCYCGLCVMETITNIADAVRDVPRKRKVLLFVGASLALQAPTPDCGFRMKDARTKMFAAIDRSGIMIHAIDPIGLQPVGPAGNAGSTLRGRAAGRAQSAAIVDNLAMQGELDVLPSHTGGRFVRNSNDPELDVAPILQESESYYLLGFYPASGSADGRVHKIEVKTKKRGLDVRTRRTYVSEPVTATSATTVAMPTVRPDSPAGLASPAARAAITALVPVRRLPLRAEFVAVDTESAPGASVAVAVEVGAPDAAEGAVGARLEHIELLTLAFDRRGRSRAAARETKDVTWPAVSTATTRRSPAQLITHIALGPGDYDIRVAVVGEGDRVGSLFTSVVVPDYARDPLAMSGVTLAAPTREFRRTDRPSASLRVYQGLALTGAVAPVTMRVKVTNASDVVRVDESSVLGAELFTKARFADCEVALPLSRLVPGEYLLSISVVAGSRSSARTVRFTVLP